MIVFSYNAVERREVCKGGREVTKKSAQSQTSNKGSAAPRPQSSHNARRNDVSAANPTNQAAKATRPSSAGGPAYDEQVLCFQISQTVDYQFSIEY